MLNEGIIHLGVIDDMHWAFRGTDKELTSSILPDYKVDEMAVAAGDALERLRGGASPLIFRKNVRRFYQAAALARVSAEHQLATLTLKRKKASFGR